jgi:hypothetical protein
MRPLVNTYDDETRSVASTAGERPARDSSVIGTASLMASSVAPPAVGRGGAAEIFAAFRPPNSWVVAVARRDGSSRRFATRPRGRICLRSAGDTDARGTRLDFNSAASVAGCPSTLLNVGAATTRARSGGRLAKDFAYWAAAALLAS